MSNTSSIHYSKATEEANKYWKESSGIILEKGQSSTSEIIRQNNFEVILLVKILEQLETIDSKQNALSISIDKLKQPSQPYTEDISKELEEITGKLQNLNLGTKYNLIPKERGTFFVWKNRDPRDQLKEYKKNVNT